MGRWDDRGWSGRLVHWKLREDLMAAQWHTPTSRVAPHAGLAPTTMNSDITAAHQNRAILSCCISISGHQEPLQGRIQLALGRPAGRLCTAERQCGSQSGPAGGQLYNDSRGTAWPPLTQRGAQSRGILWWEARAGSHQQSKRDPGGGKRVEWAGRRLFWPQWHRPTMDTWCPALLPVSGKKRRQMGISPRAPMQPYCSIRVEGCRGINGFKLIRRMSGSSC